MLKVFRSSVKPILEYAVQVWQDIPGYLSDRIESVQKRHLKSYTFSSFNNVLVLLCVIFLTYMCCPQLCSHGGWLLLKCSAIGVGFNGAETNYGIARIFRYPTDEQLGHVDIFFSNYHNLQSVYFEFEYPNSSYSQAM